METAYRELANLKERLPKGNPIGSLYIREFNDVLRNAYSRTRHNQILGLYITDADVMAVRPDPQAEIEYYCARPLYLGRLEKALTFFEKTALSDADTSDTSI